MYIHTYNATQQTLILHPISVLKEMVFNLPMAVGTARIFVQASDEHAWFSLRRASLFRYNKKYVQLYLSSVNSKQ